MARRAQINLEGDATMTAMGDYFEIWNAATYEAEEASQSQAFLDSMPDGFDPLSLIDDAGGV